MKLTENDLYEIRAILEDGGDEVFSFGKNEAGFLCVCINTHRVTEYHNGDNSDFWVLINSDLGTHQLAKKPKKMKTTLIPVLSVSTDATGSHLSLYPVGTKADDLVHDYDPASGKPTYAEGVYVEMVTEKQAEEVRARGKVSFSDTNEFRAWRGLRPL